MLNYDYLNSLNKISNTITVLIKSFFVKRSPIKYEARISFADVVSLDLSLLKISHIHTQMEAI